MLTFDEMEYHPTSEKLVKILCDKTQNPNPLFFRVLVGFYLAQIASMMRVTVATHDRGDIPVNMYALNLSASGSGKGFSTNIMENEVTHQFRQRFLDETFPLLAENNLPKLSLKRANRKSTDPDEELVRVTKEFDNLGTLLFSFSEATPPAIKQLRHKLLMADAGSLNLQIDEIGSNLVSSIDVLNTFLELYDVGSIKGKLTKNSSENVRGEEIIGKTPTNMMLFGTPAKLLNGGKTEEELYSMLEIGYARRCFFGYGRIAEGDVNQTPEEVYDQLTQSGSSQFLNELADKLENLADIINVNRRLVMSKDTSLILIEYRLKCEREASQYPEHEEIKKAEISHRYFKALKLAGAYAFVDDSVELTTPHLYQAIKLAEESGTAFNKILTRDRNYVKLAKYVATVKRDVTQADLTADLPFYRGATSQKQDMLTLATAWGYKNNIIIKKSFGDGIEFLRGETLKETDLNKMVISYSTDMTTDYRNEHAPFDDLHKLTQAPGLHWVAHHLNGGYRNEENCIAGFNLVVIDIDGGVNISTAKLLLKDYKFLLYTTKRHTADENRFRMILPINYELVLDAKDYKEFMTHIYEWLPFEVDTATGQRARKWLSHGGIYEYNTGEVLDALPFIPKTSKNEERKIRRDSQQSMDNLERWVINNIGDGNRNNMLLRYAMVLLDGGFDFEAIRQRIIALNDKIPDKLDESEIMATVMVTVAKTMSKR
jgi:Primase C terminal 1 (PriCT-1)